MVLTVGHTSLFDTVSQYLTVEWFKVVFLYQAFNAVDIHCPSNSGLVIAGLTG